MRLALVLLASAAVGCSKTPADLVACPAALNTHPTGAAWSALDDTRAPVSVSFSVTIDPNGSALSSSWRQPQADAVVIGGGGAGVTLRGGAKRFATASNRLYLELYLVNDGALGLDEVTLTPSGYSGAAAFSISEATRSRRRCRRHCRRSPSAASVPKARARAFVSASMRTAAGADHICADTRCHHDDTDGDGVGTTRRHTRR